MVTIIKGRFLSCLIVVRSVVLAATMLAVISTTTREIACRLETNNTSKPKLIPRLTEKVRTRPSKNSLAYYKWSSYPFLRI